MILSLVKSGSKRMEVLKVASVELNDAMKTLQLFLQKQTDCQDSDITVSDDVKHQLGSITKAIKSIQNAT
uniref:AlNc14C172G8029 protein n=1 Tax=Albugo laibachii Nc14 TaxID=890382 RepID=F0WNK6_9STRA|nr:AlNc14C172G8029 [Albugo laibachii Nc14]|eukprot:CCA22897.1 AlNc14C172G8029 [Albugo laibachii Nc14]